MYCLYYSKKYTEQHCDSVYSMDVLTKQRFIQGPVMPSCWGSVEERTESGEQVSYGRRTTITALFLVGHHSVLDHKHTSTDTSTHTLTHIHRHTPVAVW